MILPSSTPPATNGTSPFNWKREQLGSIDRMMLDRGVKTAYKAVYGNCTPPGSYSNQGVNLMVDVASAPAPSDVIASSIGASSLLSANPLGDQGGSVQGPQSNSGQSAGTFSDAPVNTIPLQGGSGYPTPTPIPSQTTSQGLVPPVIPGATMALRRPKQTCPINARPQRMRLALPPAGQAPVWGSAFQSTPGPTAPAASFDLLDWVKQNPWAALLIGAGAVAIFSSGGGK